MADDSIHIVSLVMMTRPANLDDVKSRITDVDGSEIHATSPEGKLVVTVEADSNRELLERVETLQGLEGLVASNLVYHQMA
ncbi:chaperone NapD [Marinobacterium jannaschii]|uniref:chaperone NapD n=1 Tax=Marinobacterium jannaschii TaxID=64970 RepID=UPI0004866376|nr:chaperone NapD [Marinobacterium jannaschii]